ncbi:MAG: hypothetical protein U0892_03375 [Pirellulales bacterium]
MRRFLTARIGYAGVLSAALFSFSGCQTWSQMGQGALQSASRVPAPPTNSYAVPKGAYNPGTSAMLGTGGSGVTTASASSPTGSTGNVTTAGYQMPSTSQVRREWADRAVGAINDAQTRMDRFESDAGRVVQAGAETVTAAGSLGREFTEAAPTLRPAGSSTRSLSDSGSTNLNWQSPGSSSGPQQ